VYLVGVGGDGLQSLSLSSPFYPLNERLRFMSRFIMDGALAVIALPIAPYGCITFPDVPANAAFYLSEEVGLSSQVLEYQ
jgi:hypothetical protein